MSELYKRLVELCESKGVTGYRMCKDCRLSPSTMTDLKAGRKKTLNAESASRVAEYFGVSVQYLYGQETKKSPAPEGEGMDEFTFAAHGYSGRLTDADKATIIKMMETLAAANEEDNGQTDGGIQ